MEETNLNQPGIDPNVVSFKSLITKIQTFDRYNPSRADLSIESLITKKTEAESFAAAVIVSKTNFKNSVSARKIAFEGNDKLMTRVLSALKISGVAAHTVTQVESMIRDVKGIRLSDRLTEEEIAAAKEKGEEVNQNTIHNKTFDKKLENFNKLVNFMGTIAEYKPNEEDLKFATLVLRVDAQRVANETVSNALAMAAAARIARDKFLYTPATGLIDLVTDVKLYVKSVYGADSPEFKQVSSIRFTKK